MAGLVIHIGDCKAGSTSIQRVMASGGWTAGGRSIVYARAARRRSAHHQLADTLFVEPKKAAAPRVWGAVAKELAAIPAERLVVSSERFEFVAPRALAEALEAHVPGAMEDLRLIAYVRPHAERVTSGYAQRTKQAKIDQTLDAFHDMTLKRGGFLFAPRLDAWRAVFGDRLTVRPLIRDRLLKRCAVHDLVGWAAETEDVTLSVPSEANSSITLEDLAIIREIRRAAKHPGQVRPICRRLGEMMGSSPPAAGTKLRLHRSLAERIARDYAEDAAAVDARFCGGESVFVRALGDAVATALPEPQKLDAADILPEDTLRLVRLMSRLVVEMAGTRPTPNDAPPDGAPAQTDAQPS